MRLCKLLILSFDVPQTVDNFNKIQSSNNSILIIQKKRFFVNT